MKVAPILSTRPSRPSLSRELRLRRRIDALLAQRAAKERRILELERIIRGLLADA